MKNRFYKEYQEKDIQAFEYTKKLQKENEELRQQVEILKKAAAYFAKENKDD